MGSVGGELRKCANMGHSLRDSCAHFGFALTRKRSIACAETRLLVYKSESKWAEADRRRANSSTALKIRLGRSQSSVLHSGPAKSVIHAYENLLICGRARLPKSAPARALHAQKENLYGIYQPHGTAFAKLSKLRRIVFNGCRRGLGLTHGTWNSIG
jgi:hypothetical protein